MKMVGDKCEGRFKKGKSEMDEDLPMDTLLSELENK
jgi:hypothetical protein